MKILFLTSSLHTGGAERVATTLANAWVARGDQVTLMPTFSGGGQCFYTLNPGVGLVYLADLVPAKGKTFKQQIARLKALRGYIKSYRPDVIVSFLPHVNVAVILASLGLGIPTLICEHTDPFAFPLSSGIRLACKVAYPFADALMVLTDGIAAKYAEHGRFLPKVYVVPNPFFDQLMEINHDYGKNKKSRLLLGVGRLNDGKQFNIYINAFAKLAERYPDWSLRIAGEGPSRPELEQQIKLLGLENRISLPGINPAVQDELNAADVFALTSKYEGFPMVLLEAMAVGLPCVSFDCPSGPREMSKDGEVALLVPPNDEQGLTEALESLMTNADLREKLGQEARASVIARYSLPVILKKWDAIFDEMKVKR